MKSTDQDLSIVVETRLSMGYRTYLPEDYSESGDPLPLLFFMHGSGERGMKWTPKTGPVKAVV